MRRDEIKRCIVGPVGSNVVVVFASRRDNKGITVQLERAPQQPNVARPSEQFNQIEMHTRHHDDPGGFSNSQRGRDGSGSQSDRGKGCRDEDRARERDRYNDSNRNRDSQRCRDSDRVYTSIDGICTNVCGGKLSDLVIARRAGVVMPAEASVHI